MEGQPPTSCEKGGCPMADSPHQSDRNQVHAHLCTSERLLSANAPNSTTESRRASNDSIKRLENIIAFQESRVEKMRHQSIGSPSEARRLLTSTKDLLLTYKHTLQRIRQSAETLELSWAMLDS